jgi:hypothetical protein
MGRAMAEETTRVRWWLTRTRRQRRDLSGSRIIGFKLRIREDLVGEVQARDRSSRGLEVLRDGDPMSPPRPGSVPDDAEIF